VRVAVEELAGVGKVVYDPGEELFTADYDPGLTDPAAIFAAVFVAGKKMGQEYLPRLVA
jgi:hypothetical protein